ncbi:MAG: DinB family protein [Acidobacteriota bacterium]|nr:DinB family protein [Acidobacteriota bacterium]
MLTHMIHAYDLQLNLAKRLVSDIPDDQMCAQPHGLVNHPTWSLGHLIMTAHGVSKMIGIATTAPAGWDELFKTGGIPSSNPTGQPNKTELIAELEKVHDSWKAGILSVDASALDAEHPDEKMRAYFPTVGAMVAFIMTSHEMDHLGQISAWRRAAGLGPAQ